MGILSSLGEIAEGASAGLTQAQIDRGRRAQNEAAEAANKEAKRQRNAEADFAANFQYVPAPGTDLGGRTVDEYVREQRAAAEASQAPMSQEDKGVVGKLAGIFSLKNMLKNRIASGFTDPPPAPVDPSLVAKQPPKPSASANLPPYITPIVDPRTGVAEPAAAPGLPQPDAAPAAAAPAAAPGLPTAAAARPSAAPTSTLDQVNMPEVGVTPRTQAETGLWRDPRTGVEGPDTRPTPDDPGAPKVPENVPVFDSDGQGIRPATAIDRQLYLAREYAKLRQFDKAIAAQDKYNDMVIDRTLSVIDTGRVDMINDMATKALGKPVSITRNAKDPNLFSMSVDGEPVLVDVGRGEIKGTIAQAMYGDPALKARYVAASREEVTAREEAAGKATVRASEIAARGAVQGQAEANTAETRVDTAGKVAGAQQAAKFETDLQDNSVRGAIILDPARFTQFLRSGGIKYADKFYTSDTEMDPQTQLAVKTARNKLEKDAADDKKTWDTNRWVKQGLVQVVRPADGKPYFTVITPEGRVGTHHPSLDGALSQAQNDYTNPEAASKLITANYNARHAAEKAEQAKTPEGQKAAVAEAAKAAAAKAAADKKAADAKAAAAAKKVGMPKSYREVVGNEIRKGLIGTHRAAKVATGQMTKEEARKAAEAATKKK